MEQPGFDGISEAEVEVPGCEEVWGGAHSRVGVQNYLCGKVLYYGARGLASASRRVGNCEKAREGMDGYACVARRV